MEGPLEEAWAVAKAAKDLRCALEGGGNMGGWDGPPPGWQQLDMVDFFLGGENLKKNRLEKKRNQHTFFLNSV